MAASGTGPTASTETHSVCHRYDTCGTLVIDATAEQYISEMAFQINSDPSVSVTSFYDGTDDGSWKVVSVTECTSPSPTIVATLEPTPKTCLTFKMVDSFGDGWSEATYYWQNTDTGEAVATGTLTGTGYGTDQFCYNDVGECYVLAVTADTYPSEVSWSLELPDGTVWLTGGASTTNYMCAPTLSPTMSPVPTMSKMPSSVPTKSETPLPTTDPSSVPSLVPSPLPTTDPSSVPSLVPTISSAPTTLPTITPVPSAVPTELERCYTLEMEDWYGDGWNGATYTWTNKANSQQLLTGTLADGTNGTASLCVYSTSQCYSLEVSSGAYDREISWALISPDGSSWANGGAPGTADLCAPSPVPTTPVPSISSVPSPVPTVTFKPTSHPTTPQPTESPTTPGVCHTLNLYDSYGDGWNGAAWTWINLDRGVTLSTGTLSSGGSSTNPAPICTYDSSDCYTLVLSVGATTIILPG